MRRSSRRIPEVFLLALSAACGGTAVRPTTAVPPATEPSLPAAPRQLDDAEITAIASLLRLEDLREPDTATLHSLLRHESGEVRRRAALAAGRIGHASATPLLLDGLVHEDTTLVRAAAFALGVLRDSTEAVTSALVRLLDDAGGPAANARVEAAAALGKLGTPAAEAAVVRSLATYRSDRRARSANGDAVAQEALLTIWRFPDAARHADVVLPLLEHDDPAFRWRATYALMRMAAPAAASDLAERLEDREPLVRALAARAFRAGYADSARVRDAVRPRLVDALADPEAPVRIQAINALAGWAEPGLTPALLARLDDEDDNVRLAAAQALGGFEDRAVGVRLRAVVEDPGSPIGVRAAALSALARVDPGAASVEAGRWGAAPVWLHRLLAVRAAGALPAALAVGVLGPLAGDADPRVARAALTALGRVADSTSTAYALYVQTLKAADPEIRAAALTGLGRLARPADLAALMDAYDAAQRDTVPVAALAAVDALAVLARDGVPVANAFFLRFSPHADAAVRGRVVRRFGTDAGAGWRDTVSVVATRARPMSFYQDVVRRFVAPLLSGGGLPRLEIGTGHGIITIALFAADAPLTVHNMVRLVESGFYSATDTLARRWHRVVPDFVLQDGDPRGDGSGGPPDRIRDEINPWRYARGSLGMALSGPDTGGSQFFIAHGPQPHLDGGYTVFGAVVDGHDAAARVVQDDLIHFMRIAWP